MADTLAVNDVSDRRSTRKRKVVESYAADDSQSGDKIVRPAPLPSRKRKKGTPEVTVISSEWGVDGIPDSSSNLKKGTKVIKPPKVAKAKGKTIDVEAEYDGEQDVPVKEKGKKKTTSKDGEKRLKRFRKELPTSIETLMERATTQRMYILERKRHSNPDCPHSTPDCPIEVVDLAGTTGNIYTVTISHIPTCSCPNFAKGNPQCKHILYVLVKVLKAPDPLHYQLAFLTSELHRIFDNAGPLPTDTASAQDTDGKRKPIEGDCPICVEELNPDTENIVWCSAACGNNLHKACFDQWAASKSNKKVTCPYCRTPWESTVDAQALKNVDRDDNATRNADGYVNIAGQLGLSGQRDYSTYHGYWVRREVKARRVTREEAGEHLEWEGGYGYGYDG